MESLVNRGITNKRQVGVTYTQHAYQTIVESILATKSDKVKILLIMMLLNGSQSAGTILMVRNWLRTEYNKLATIAIPYYTKLYNANEFDKYLQDELQTFWGTIKSQSEDKALLRDAIVQIYPTDYKTKFKFLS